MILDEKHRGRQSIDELKQPRYCSWSTHHLYMKAEIAWNELRETWECSAMVAKPTKAPVIQQIWKRSEYVVQTLILPKFIIHLSFREFQLVNTKARTHWDFELFSSSNHISPLLNRPQGCQGCQKNRKCLRITTMIRFAANFQPKLNELHKHLQNQQKSSKYAGFLVLF